jgi:hypothetical protein
MEGNMKVLIAITTWITGAITGENQAMRDTFLKDVDKYPNLEYRFFLGNGAATGEDESALDKSYTQVLIAHGDRYDKRAPLPCHYDPKKDEIFLHTPDDFKHNCYKTKYNRVWAEEKEFDFVFQCTSDTYIDIERLMHSGFENYDYIGYPSGCYARGGNGYWTSRKASKIIIDTPVTLWAEDWFVGVALTNNGIILHPDERYVEYPDIPKKTNDYISSHLGNPTYNTRAMYNAHYERYQ